MPLAGALCQTLLAATGFTNKVSQRNPDEFLVSDPAGIGGSLYFMKVPVPKGARTGCT